MRRFGSVGDINDSFEKRPRHHPRPPPLDASAAPAGVRRPPPAHPTRPEAPQISRRLDAAAPRPPNDWQQLQHAHEEELREEQHEPPALASVAKPASDEPAPGRQCDTAESNGRAARMTLSHI